MFCLSGDFLLSWWLRGSIIKGCMTENSGCFLLWVTGCLACPKSPVWGIKGKMGDARGSNRVKQDPREGRKLWPEVQASICRRPTDSGLMGTNVGLHIYTISTLQAPFFDSSSHLGSLHFSNVEPSIRTVLSAVKNRVKTTDCRPCAHQGAATVRNWAHTHKSNFHLPSWADSVSRQIHGWVEVFVACQSFRFWVFNNSASRVFTLTE